MEKMILMAMPGNEDLAAELCRAGGHEPGELLVRRFPDGESYVRLLSECRGRHVGLVCTLQRPDEQTLPLLFVAEALREHGAAKVTLVAPYLAYMRQDAAFRPGEGVTSRYFARLLSRCIDALVTIDPHLHRHDSLRAIYPIDAKVLHAAPHLAAWIAKEIEDPVLVGPDAESAQWVGAVAEHLEAPYTALSKVRSGDCDVAITGPQLEDLARRTPVIIDDIISTGGTMAETVTLLRKAGSRPPVCIGIHAVFADGALTRLKQAGAGRVVSTNTIRHETNQIDIVSLLDAALRGASD